jgi:SpoVK/Ycf46/Vps4 family AAA+-type ATPase
MKSKNLFIQIRNNLHEQLYEDSENGLENIVQTLARYDSIYRTFNEGLRLSQSESKKQRLPNSLIDYIHHAHTAYVVISLRKLYEEKENSNKRSVNSLRTITKQILDNAHLFTRENYVTYDNLPYNDSENLDRKTRAKVQERHGRFDSLCRIKKGMSRKMSDKFDINIPQMLHERTQLRPEIDVFANKFLAHASAKNNRPDEKLTLQKATLLCIQNQYKNVIWSSQQIAKILCEAFLSEVPIPQFDILLNWENGLFDNATKRKLEIYYNQRMHWWWKWSNYYREGNKIFTSPGASGK